MASSRTEQYRRMGADIVVIPLARLPEDGRERWLPGSQSEDERSSSEGEGALGERVVE